MIQGLEKLLKETLTETNRITPDDFGPKDFDQVDSATIDRLTAKMSKESGFNNMMIIVIIVMIFILFLVAIYLIIRNATDPGKLKLIFGGTFLTTLTIIATLRKLWREKNSIDMLIALLPELSPVEALRVIEVLYFSKKKLGRDASA